MKLLHYRADIRSIAFVLLAIAVPAVQWAGLLNHPALYLAAFLLAFIACVINHNHQHHPTLVPRWLNKLFGVLLSIATGVPASAIILLHNYNHHLHNNHDEDYVRASIVRLRPNLINLLLFPLAAFIRYAPVKARELRRWRTTRPSLYRQLWLERLVVYPLLLALLIVAPWETFVYVVLPQLFGQWGILAINHIQHDGCDPDSEYNHSRNFVGRWLNWWVFNNGYHTAHHRRPGLHWSLLPQFHEEIRLQIDAALERRSLALGIIEYYLCPGQGPIAINASAAMDNQSETENERDAVLKGMQL
jgi:fatty acid desaturase